MRLFQLEYVKDCMRARGFPISRETTKRDICLLLSIHKKTTMKEICEILDIEYVSLVGERENNNKIPIGAISERFDIMSFDSMTDASKFFQTYTENIFLSLERNVGFPFNQTLWYFTRL